MAQKLSRFLDVVSGFLAHRKGLLPMVGILLILLNFILNFFTLGWFSQSDFFLHLGIIIAILGFMFAWAL
jgi:hypothetical protein